MPRANPKPFNTPRASLSFWRICTSPTCPGSEGFVKFAVHDDNAHVKVS